MYKSKIFLTALIIAVPTAAFAWSGSDSDSGADVEIYEGNTVRAGESIEVEDSERGTRNIDVDDVRSSGSGATIEGTDSDTGEPVELDME